MWADLRSLWEAPAGTSLSLAIDTPGSVTLDGQSVALSLGLALDAGAISFQGQSITASIGLPLTAGSLTVVGQSATFALNLAATNGSITLDGQAIPLSLSGALALAIDAPGTFNLTGQTVDLTLTGGTDAGRPRRRIREIYRVTVDGEVFEFASLAEALELLNRAQALAARVAAQKARQATERAIPQRSQPTLALPRIAVNSRDLRPAVTETKRVIAETYRRALVDAEIAVLIELKTRDEQNEDAMWLLM